MESGRLFDRLEQPLRKEGVRKNIQKGMDRGAAQRYVRSDVEKSKYGVTLCTNKTRFQLVGYSGQGLHTV